MLPKASIIVPTYNREVMLEKCLESIIAQNYPNLEIIVTDDNSSDNTEELMRNYTKKFPFVKYVKNKRYPQGPNGNKNNGLDHATGEIIGIFDDDDTMVEGSLKIMIGKILEGYDVVMGNCRIVSDRWDNGTFAGKGLTQSGDVNWRDYLCGKIYGEYWSLFKKELLGEKRFDTDLYGGEGTLWRGMLKEAKIFYFHQAVRNYTIGEHGNISDKMVKKASIVIKNYERDIFYYGDEMKRNCPCYLAAIYKGAAYFAKLSSQYMKGFRYVAESIILCPKYSAAYLMFVVMFLPKKTIPFLSKIRTKFSRD